MFAWQVGRTDLIIRASDEVPESVAKIFESVLASRNHVGLLSEDVDPETGELWGNFPQTYCMVGIINSAALLSKPWAAVT